MKRAAPRPGRPHLHQLVSAEARLAHDGEQPEALAQQLVELITRPNRPTHPRLALAYAYGRLALTILSRPDVDFAAGDAELRKLEHAVRSGVVRVDQRDSLLSTVAKARAGNADARRYLLSWLGARPHVRRTLARAPTWPPERSGAPS